MVIELLVPIIKGVGNNSSQSSGSILILVHSSISHTSSLMNIFYMLRELEFL